jgi:hypothetical protein
MVTDWLKLDLIRQFFGLLSEDSANDKRRLKFWESYHKNIDDMYFALGSYARNNRSRDFIDLRKKMAGRVLDLNAGGLPRNNAFIMRMGDHVAVEFGMSGNACFIFERRNLPFDLGGSAVAGDRSELKHDDHIERLLHIDTGVNRWEQIFEQTLQRHMDVWPVREETTGQPSTTGAAFRGRQNETTRGTQCAEKASYSRRELERFCTSRALKIVDRSTQRGGNLWVVTDQSDRAVNRQLSEWRFRYKPNKGWWRETP